MSKAKKKPARTYSHRDFHPASVRKARCGHISKEGRYFKCEKCEPILQSDNGDWNYFADNSDIDTFYIPTEND